MKPARFTLRRLMTVLALIAVVLGAIRHKMVVAERARLAALKSDLARAEDRMAWSQAMRRKGYVSPATARRDRARLSAIKKEMREYRPIVADPAK